MGKKAQNKVKIIPVYLDPIPEGEIGAIEEELAQLLIDAWFAQNAEPSEISVADPKNQVYPTPGVA